MKLQMPNEVLKEDYKSYSNQLCYMIDTRTWTKSEYTNNPEIYKKYKEYLEEQYGEIWSKLMDDLWGKIDSTSCATTCYTTDRTITSEDLAKMVNKFKTGYDTIITNDIGGQIVRDNGLYPTVSNRVDGNIFMYNEKDMDYKNLLKPSKIVFRGEE